MSRIGLGGLVVMLVLLPRLADAQSPPANTEVRSFALPPLEELQATRERPLFSPRRRPDIKAAPQAETPVEEDPASLPFELTGVVMGADRAIAILRNRETQETVHLRQGETLEAWSLEEIAPRHVVLRHDDRQVRLELFEQKPDGAPGTPPPIPPQAKPIRMETPQQRIAPVEPRRRTLRRTTPPRRAQ